MTNIPISQEAETNQENDKTIDTQTLPKRPERPPLMLVSQGGAIVEKPSNVQIADEINMTVLSQIRVVYDLFMEINEEFFDYPKGKEAIVNTLFTAIERLENLLRYL